MELLTNIAWLFVSLMILGATAAAVQRKLLRVPPGRALLGALLLCLLLLPVISMTDDLLENRQAALPLAAQSWHLASEAAAVGLELVSLVSTWLLLLLFESASVSPTLRMCEPGVRPYAAWLTRAQRLRPPPARA